MKQAYQEGEWFSVPLREGGAAVGLAARARKRGKIVLGYFFGPRRHGVPDLAELDSLRPADAVLVARFGDLALIQGEWPVLGRSPSWDRSRWPMPRFVRSEELSGRVWEVEYSDVDPNKVVAERPFAGDPRGLPRDELFGAGAVEIVLGKLLR
jgi:hypothetical protein